MRNMLKDLGNGIVLHPFKREYKLKWLQLVTFWENRYSFSNVPVDGLLFHVLHKIYWGMYPDCTYTKEQMEMFVLLEEVLLNSKKAKQTWMKTKYVMGYLAFLQSEQRAFVKNGLKCVTEIHGQYLRDRADVLLADTVDEDDLFRIQNYEQVIKNLLSEAEGWSAEAWLDEKEIFKGMSEKYNIVFDSNDPNYKGDDYTVFINLLSSKLAGEELAYILIAANLEECSEEMARVLWPENRERMIVNLLTDAKEWLDQGVGFKDRIVNSWMFKQVSLWIDNHCLEKELFIKARKVVFDLQMCG